MYGPTSSPARSGSAAAQGLDSSLTSLGGLPLLPLVLSPAAHCSQRPSKSRRSPSGVVARTSKSFGKRSSSSSSSRHCRPDGEIPLRRNRSAYAKLVKEPLDLPRRVRHAIRAQSARQLPRQTERAVRWSVLTIPKSPKQLRSALSPATTAVFNQPRELIIGALRTRQQQSDVCLGLIWSEARQRDGQLDDLVEVALGESLTTRRLSEISRDRVPHHLFIGRDYRPSSRPRGRV